MQAENILHTEFSIKVILNCNLHYWLDRNIIHEHKNVTRSGFPLSQGVSQVKKMVLATNPKKNYVIPARKGYILRASS